MRVYLLLSFSRGASRPQSRRCRRRDRRGFHGKGSKRTYAPSRARCEGREGRRCARRGGAGKVRAERTPGKVGRRRGQRETAGGHEERRPRLATEKAKLPASANWFSGISRLQVVVGENNDDDGDEDDDDDDDDGY